MAAATSQAFSGNLKVSHLRVNCCFLLPEEGTISGRNGRV